MSELADHPTDRYGVTVEGLVGLDQDGYRVDGPGWVADGAPTPLIRFVRAAAHHVSAEEDPSA